MKAIQTMYKGCRFRSRLEARWAVYFDFMDIEWLYEPEGYVKTIRGCDGDPDEVIKYLPDFYLPVTKTWVEVKGKLSNKDAERMAYFLDYGCPLPGFDYSMKKIWDGEKEKSILIILGEIPDPFSSSWIFHKAIAHYKGLHCSYASFSVGSDRLVTPHDVSWDHFDSLGEATEDLANYLAPDSCCLYNYRMMRVSDKERKALIAARSARYEYGENNRA